MTRSTLDRDLRSGPDPTETAELPAVEHTPGPRTGLRGLVHRAGRLRTALVAVTVVGCAVAAPLGVVAWHAARTDSAQAAAVAAAVRTVSDLTTVEAGTAQQSYDRLKAGATGTWAEQLASQDGAFVGALQQAQVVSRGSVTAAAVQEGDTERATVLVSATASVRNVQSSVGEPRQYRLRMDVENQDGAWRIATLDFVP